MHTKIGKIRTKGSTSVFLQSKNVKGLTCISNDIENDIGVYLKLFTLLYADDTILYSDSVNDLQLQLNSFNEYCEIWKLKINTDKTKFMVFSKGHTNQEISFKINGKNIERVYDFNYLGLILSHNGSYTNTKKHNIKRAYTAMYDILKKGRQLNLSVKTQYDLFEKMVKPILLYGCEIWGYTNLEIIGRVHLKFCKLLLKVKKNQHPVSWFMENLVFTQCHCILN